DLRARNDGREEGYAIQTHSTTGRLVTGHHRVGYELNNVDPLSILGLIEDSVRDLALELKSRDLHALPPLHNHIDPSVRILDGAVLNTGQFLPQRERQFARGADSEVNIATVGR